MISSLYSTFFWDASPPNGYSRRLSRVTQVCDFQCGTLTSPFTISCFLQTLFLAQEQVIKYNMLISVTRKKEIFIRNPLFFPFMNRARDPLHDPLWTLADVLRQIGAVNRSRQQRNSKVKYKFNFYYAFLGGRCHCSWSCLTLRSLETNI